MRSLSWLHFTDFHLGVEPQRWLWPSVRDSLFTDLEKLHGRCGPWDLVLLSGDLTQRGSTEEFARLDEVLGQLFDHLRRLGSTPSLLAVPGNHDLVRPDAKQPAALVLADWSRFPEVQAEFWGDARSPYRALVDQMFAPFTAWHTRHGLCALQWAPGLLPGDGSAVLVKDGLRWGVVGLNSSFLQVSGGDHKGKLAVDVRQFHATCGGDGPAWVADCDFALIMTHHPPDWLSTAAQEHFVGEIAPPGRFVAHLFGHMHEHMATTVGVGGAAPQRRIQGSSLFGLETFGDGKLERRHGYAAGCIAVDERSQAGLRLWPRAARRHTAGYWRIVQDLEAFELGDDQGTQPEPLARKPTRHLRPLGGAMRTIPADPMTLQPAGAPYHTDWHVRRDEEKVALNRLAHQSPPVVLLGPEKFGKTWFLRHLLHVISERDGPATKILHLNFDDVAVVHDSYLQFIQAVMAALETSADGIPTAQDSPHASPNARLTNFIRRILATVQTRLIVAMDSFDQLWKLPTPWRDDFFSLLRAWTQKPDLAKFRMIMVVSTTPYNLIDRTIGSPFNLPPINLGDLSSEQCVALARLYELNWRGADFDELAALVGGHPYLVRHTMHSAALAGGVAPRELLEPENDLFNDFIDRYSRRLAKDSELAAAIRRLKLTKELPLDSATEMHLETLGLTLKNPKTGLSRLRYRLYERLRL